MNLTKDTAQVYKLRGHKEEKNAFAWAVIIIRSWKGGGSIDVQSDFGNYAYIWSSIGDCDIREFLSKIGYDYFMGKAHHTRGYVTDWEATGNEIKRLILEARRDGMNAERARECYDALESIDKDEGFFWNAREYPALGRFLSDHEHPTRRERDGDCNGFWTVIWPEICKVWKEELAIPAARTCTCLGTCKGAEGLSPGWVCALAAHPGLASTGPTP